MRALVTRPHYWMPFMQKKQDYAEVRGSWLAVGRLEHRKRKPRFDVRWRKKNSRNAALNQYA